nr:MAG TPA: hypothetical protein [Caudoviricetes sp.]
MDCWTPLLKHFPFKTPSVLLVFLFQGVRGME